MSLWHVDTNHKLIRYISVWLNMNLLFLYSYTVYICGKVCNIENIIFYYWPTHLLMVLICQQCFKLEPFVLLWTFMHKECKELWKFQQYVNICFSLCSVGSIIAVDFI
jgi:hypothetical protein